MPATSGVSHLRALAQLRREQLGATMIEYVVVCGMVLAVSIALITAISGNVDILFGRLNTWTADAAAAAR
jgi:Flp pilus assembly pilin Flp